MNHRFKHSLFISSNPRWVSRSKLRPKGTNNPVNFSCWINLTESSLTGSIVRACSPSNNQGRYSLPNQRSSWFGSTFSTLGRKVMPLVPEGWMNTLSLAPTLTSPVARRMNGFQLGKALKSVINSHNRSAEELISISFESCLENTSENPAFYWQVYLYNC